MCTQEMAVHEKMSFFEYMPFIVCLQQNYAQIFQAEPPNGNSTIERVVNSCVKEDALANNVMYCFHNKNMSSPIEVRMAQNTPDDEGMPLVQITNKDGKTSKLDLGNLTEITKETLLQAVCDTWEFNGGNRSIVPQCPSKPNDNIASPTVSVVV